MTTQAMPAHTLTPQTLTAPALTAEHAAAGEPVEAGAGLLVLLLVVAVLSMASMFVMGV
jgi:hypothetical protein